MQLNRMYDCKHCTKGYLGNLEHWRGYFEVNDDEYADEIIQMFDDKIHEVKLQLEKLELRKTKLKTYKFWNPDYVSKYISLDVIDPHTCTAAELAEAETNGNISTDILLIDDKQAEAIVRMFTNETNYEAFRYEEIKENV